MNITKFLTIISILFLFQSMIAQNGVIKGNIKDESNNEAVPFANILIQDFPDKGSSSDIDGNFQVAGLEPGLYTIEISSIGYATKLVSELRVTNAKPTIVDVILSPSSQELSEVVVQASPFEKKAESPVAVKTIGIAEIERNPGANRDISKVIQSLPGVAATPGFRNDIIIRGGGPNENRFYLDGIEVPNINHFATQGASGGPVGLLNVNFIEEVDLYSGAFPAMRGNALSSVLEFKQKDGNPDNTAGAVTLGSNDLGLTLEGPINQKTTYIASIRYSYLQFLFELLKLPFLPTYTDAQFKIKTKLNTKNQLTFIGLGALDQFQLNESINEGVTDPETLERNNYTLANLPVNEQWNYTIGAKYTHFGKKGFQNFVVSRSMLNNTAYKYLNNDESNPDNQILDYKSQESENKFRFENISNYNKWRVSYGAGYEFVRYLNDTKNRFYTTAGLIEKNFYSKLTFNKYSLFGQVSRNFAKEKLLLSFGIRTDFTDYSSEMNNPLEQLSPRVSASYQLTKSLSFNANVGLYYQLPANTVLGYRDNNDVLVNQEGGMKYISSLHYVAGFEYLTKFSSRITVEGFYKDYSNYPFMLNDSVSLANLGADFGVIGNGPATSVSEGQAYGVEFLYQQKMFKGFFGILAYTVVWSEFTDDKGNLAPSSWDARNTVSLTMGKKFKKGWEFGAKWRFSSGNPYTPYDIALSSQKQVWDVNQSGILNYAYVNTERLSAFHGLDVRVDKKWYWDKINLNLYFDIQNLYNFQTEAPAYLDTVKDDMGNPITDPNNPDAYLTKLVPNTSGTVLPTFGVIFEF